MSLARGELRNLIVRYACTGRMLGFGTMYIQNALLLILSYSSSIINNTSNNTKHSHKNAAHINKHDTPPRYQYLYVINADI